MTIVGPPQNYGAVVLKSLLERTLTSSEGGCEGRKGGVREKAEHYVLIFYFYFFVRSSIMSNELLFDALSPYTHPTGAWGLELRVLRSFKNPFLRQAFLAGRVDEGRACFLALTAQILPQPIGFSMWKPPL